MGKGIVPAICQYVIHEREPPLPAGENTGNPGSAQHFCLHCCGCQSVRAQSSSGSIVTAPNAAPHGGRGDRSGSMHAGGVVCSGPRAMAGIQQQQRAALAIHCRFSTRGDCGSGCHLALAAPATQPSPGRLAALGFTGSRLSGAGGAGHVHLDDSPGSHASVPGWCH